MVRREWNVQSVLDSQSLWQEDFHNTRCSVAKQLRLFNMRGYSCASAWRELLLRGEKGVCPGRQDLKQDNYT